VLAFVANQSRIRTHHSSAPSRWLGAQTAESDCDWLKQLKTFRERSDLAETKTV